MEERGEKTRLLKERIERNKRERFAGKVCNCFYCGEVYRCTTEGTKNNWSTTMCHIHQLDIHVQLSSTRINWSGDIEVERKWFSDYEKRQMLLELKRENDNRELKQAKYNHWNAYNERKQNRKTASVKTDLEIKRYEALKKRMDNLCGVGGRKVKMMLIALSRRFDDMAMVLRLALEIETLGIQAMGTNYPYSHKLLSRRIQAVAEMAKCCKKHNLAHGKRTCREDTYLCVALPQCETLGFHARLWTNGVQNGPVYNGEWDGRPLKNLMKIEECINRKYGKVLAEKYGEKFG